MAKQIGYKAATIRAITGLTNRQITYWEKQGIISPSIRSRLPKEWGFSELIAFKILARLREQLGFEAMRKVAQSLQHIDRSITNAKLIICGEDVFLVEEPDLVSLVKQPGQRAFMTMVIDLGVVEEEVKLALAAMAA